MGKTALIVALEEEVGAVLAARGVEWRSFTVKPGPAGVEIEADVGHIASVRLPYDKVTDIADRASAYWLLVERLKHRDETMTADQIMYRRMEGWQQHCASSPERVMVRGPNGLTTVPPLITYRPRPLNCGLWPEQR